MDTFDFVSVPIIVTCVYILIDLIKRAVGDSEKFLRAIPLLAALIGAALGVVGFFLSSNTIHAANAFEAMIIGGSSGLAATGTHQFFKQFISKQASGSSDPKDKPDENNVNLPSQEEDSSDID